MYLKSDCPKPINLPIKSSSRELRDQDPLKRKKYQFETGIGGSASVNADEKIEKKRKKRGGRKNIHVLGRCVQD